MFALSGIYAIIDPSRVAGVLPFLESILDAGIRIVQYRDKRGADPRIVAAMMVRCEAAGARLIVNDELEAAQLAHGVHLGQDDLRSTSVAAARAALGDRIIGISAATPELAVRAEQQGADYLGSGPYRATRSKETSREPLGDGGLRAVVQSVSIPVAAIGGIELGDLDAVVAAGARMAAVIGALADAPDPGAAARALVSRWNGAG